MIFAGTLFKTVCRVLKAMAKLCAHSVYLLRMPTMDNVWIAMLLYRNVKLALRIMALIRAPVARDYFH